MSADYSIRCGIPPGARGAAARLYWRSFGPALCPAGLGPRRGAALVERLMQPQRALVALAPGGTVIGLAGLRGPQGGFLQLATPGHGALPALMALALALAYRGGEATADLVLDGVAVRRGWRRRGVARALAAAAEAEARRLGHPGLRAEVEAGNRAALAAWQAMGFQVQGRERLGWIWSAPAHVLRRPLGDGDGA